MDFLNSERKMMPKKISHLKKTPIKTIAVCSSVDFFKDLLGIEKELKRLGFKTILPITIRKMKKTGDFNPASYKTWLTNHVEYKRKSYLMRDHFKKLISSDAILVVNRPKKGEKGYIGGNVLMEMALGFHHRKPIFILNPIAEDSPFYEEILGMSPNFLEGDLTKII